MNSLVTFFWHYVFPSCLILVPRDCPQKQTHKNFYIYIRAIKQERVPLPTIEGGANQNKMKKKIQQNIADWLKVLCPYTKTDVWSFSRRFAFL